MIIEFGAGLSAAAVMSAILFWPFGGRRDARQQEAEAEDARRAARAPLALLMRTDDPDLRKALSDFVERTAGLGPAAVPPTALIALQEVRKACQAALDRPSTLAAPQARRDLASQLRLAVEAMCGSNVPEATAR